MYDVRDITNFVLDAADERGIAVTNLSLQKLLYFMHGWFFTVFDQPLLKNKFEAWQYGPVQRVVYDAFKQFNNKPIKNSRALHLDPATGKKVYREPILAPEHAELVLSVLERYRDRSGGELVEESHVEDGPWEYVWQQAETLIYPGMRIPDDLIASHFRQLGSLLTYH